MFNSIGPLELGILLVIVLLIFGPKRLPSLGRSLGSGMREFRDSLAGRRPTSAAERRASALPTSDGEASAAAPRSTTDATESR